MRKTISNLSRELCVSRPRIYRAIERLGIEKKSSGEYSFDEWELLKRELSHTSKINKRKKSDARKIETSGKTRAKEAEVEIDYSSKICNIDVATLKERLQHAKQEYDYNKDLIVKFQEETKTHFKETGKTTMMTHNGTMAAIPSIINLDKYVKLNIALSKLINDLESGLDLETDGGDNPFG